MAEKRLIVINGTMGIGKSSVSQRLKKMLPRAVLLDGDWCWDADPFAVNDETKAMVIRNIAYLLSSFLNCNMYENVVFCWVMNEPDTFEMISTKIAAANYSTYRFSLISTPEELKVRVGKDVLAGIRSTMDYEKSLARLNDYDAQDTMKIDVSGLDVGDTARLIYRSVMGKEYDDRDKASNR